MGIELQIKLRPTGQANGNKKERTFKRYFSLPSFHLNRRPILEKLGNLKVWCINKSKSIDILRKA